MAGSDEEVRSPSDHDIEIVKWKVKKGSMVFKGSVLALYVDAGSTDKSHSTKLKAHASGLVSHVTVEEGTVVHPGDTLLVIQAQTDNTCTHPTIMKDMCADCGADLRREMGVAGDRKKSVSASVAMVHSIPELIVSQEQALEIGKEDENRLLKARKLVLLVDLDQTLIHTTNDNIPPNLKDVKHFQLWHGKGYMWYHTRFRPFTQHFLESVSKKYELHICTFGVRMYAHIIARLLDPEEKYFSHRILSRDECFDALSKTANLKALFPCGDKMVGIIDDREDVWNHAPNLIHVKPYRFFQGTADINAPPGLSKSEHDNEPIAHKVVDPSTEKSQSDTPNTDGGDAVQEISTDSNSKETERAATVAEGGNGLSKTGESESSQNNDNALSSDVQSTELSKSDLDRTSDTNNGKLSKTSEDKDVSHSTEESKEEEVSEPSKDKDSNKDSNMEDSAVTVKVPKSDAKKDCKVGGEGVDDKKKTESGKKKEEEEIEWDDGDDYLLHLEEILSRIHKAYYGMYEQSQRKGTSELPDLKNIIPYVMKKVLKGANIVFSGMFPLNMAAENSRAYTVAKALGANVQNELVPRKTKSGSNPDATTHLVAAKPGTGKHKSAMKMKGIHIVQGDWLWACNERWEWVDESLFPLGVKDTQGKSADSPEDNSAKEKGKSRSKIRKRKNDDSGSDVADDEDVFNSQNESLNNSGSKRLKMDISESECGDESQSQPSTSTTNVQEGDEKNFANSFNPLYSFSDEDIEFMDKEVDEIMDEDENSSDESDEERETRMRKKVLKGVEDSDSDSESLSGDFPRGWKMRRKSFSPQKDTGEEVEKRTDEEDDDETENELERYQKNIDAFAPDESDSNDDDDSVGSVDDEIAEAVEKEFLSSL